MEKLVAVVLMAGLSTRFGGPKNKQLCLLNGKPVFTYAIDAFAKHKAVNELIIAVNNDNKSEIEKYVKENLYNAKIIMGGATRQESVDNALKTLSLAENDIVIIHDGARPLVDERIINEVAKVASECGASTAYLEAIDTIAVKNEKDEVVEFVDRKTVAQIQTPQGFKYGLLKKAHEVEEKDATDDCSLILKLGNKVKLVKGDKKFHKITTIEDILYLEGLLK